MIKDDFDAAFFFICCKRFSAACTIGAEEKFAVLCAVLVVAALDNIDADDDEDNFELEFTEDAAICCNFPNPETFGTGIFWWVVANFPKPAKPDGTEVDETVDKFVWFKFEGVEVDKFGLTWAAVLTKKKNK